MPLHELWRAIPTLEQVIRRQPLFADREQVWTLLRQLLLAQAPSTGAALPGAIIDQVSDIAAIFGLADRLEMDLAGPGNPGLWLGVAKPQADVIVVASLDRPTFRVSRFVNDKTAELVAVVNGGGLGQLRHVSAAALRFQVDRSRVEVVAQGWLDHADGRIVFRLERGTLTWADLVTLDLSPRRERDILQGAGLDNAAGVLTALAVGAILRQIEETLLEHNRRCLFVFPDRRDCDLNAMRDRASGGALQPALGAMFLECQWSPPVKDRPTGMAYAFASPERPGVQVPINYQQLTRDLGDALGQAHLPPAPHFIVSQDQGDTSAPGYRQRVLGLMGPQLVRSDAGLEAVELKDIEASIWSLACYLPLILNLVPAVVSRYALGR